MYSPLNNETLMNGNLRLKSCELSLISKRSSSTLPVYCGTLSVGGLGPESPGKVLLDFALQKTLVKTLPKQEFGSTPLARWRSRRPSLSSSSEGFPRLSHALVIDFLIIQYKTQSLETLLDEIHLHLSIIIIFSLLFNKKTINLLRKLSKPPSPGK